MRRGIIFWLGLVFVVVDGAVTRLADNRNDYSGRFKVYELETRTQAHIDKLSEFEGYGLIDFWQSPKAVKSKAQLMIDERHPDAQLFHSFLEAASIKTKVLTNDLAKFIADKEDAYQRSFNLTGKWLKDDAANTFFGLQMSKYYSYNEVLEFMERVRAAMPANTVQLRNIGKSSEGRNIRGIQFGRPGNPNRPVVWIDAGIHAREWTAIHTAIYFIQQIATEIQQSNSVLAQYLETVDILIFPCLNPDGYEYTRSEPRNPSVRFWRKSRSQKRCSSIRQGESVCCNGVDLNRNFDFRFAEIGTSKHPCSEVFHGAGPFSEPETRAIRDAILHSDLQGRVAAFISLHAYSQLWIYPYSHKKFSYPDDIDDLKSVAQKAVKAIGIKYGTRYNYGSGPETIYAYTGGSADWAKETAKIKYTYTVELRPSYTGLDGFILERSQLIPTARETLDGVLVVVEAVSKNFPATFHKSRITSSLRRSPPWQSSVIGTKCEDKSANCQAWLWSNTHFCHDIRLNVQAMCSRTCRFCT